jgi:hypothetical protein
VVSWKRVVVNFTGLGESLKADDIVVIEIGLVKGEYGVVLVQLLEPGGLSWVNHGVFLEFDEHCCV